MKRKYFFKINSIIVLLISIVVLTSCDTQRIKIFIDDDTKAYCYFENGASYIYKDSITGDIDSIKISSDWHSPKTTRHGTEELLSDVTCWNGNPIGKCVIEYEGDIIITKLSVDNLFFIQPLYHSLGINVDCPNAGGVLTKIYPTFQIRDNTYYEVKKFKSNTYVNADNMYTYSYWARHVGLIKHEIYDSTNDIVFNINILAP